jgi:hypothetical protein
MGPMIEPLLLTTVRLSTFDQQQLLTRASGFFFERDERQTPRHFFEVPFPPAAIEV